MLAWPGILYPKQRQHLLSSLLALEATRTPDTRAQNSESGTAETQKPADKRKRRAPSVILCQSYFEYAKNYENIYLAEKKELKKRSKAWSQEK